MCCACGLVVYDAFFSVISCAFGTAALVRVLALTSLDLSHTLPADLFRRHARSPKGHTITPKSLRKFRQQTILFNDRLQLRVRDNDHVLALGVAADIIRVEVDLQPHRRDVPTVKVLDLRPGAALNVSRSPRLFQSLD